MNKIALFLLLKFMYLFSYGQVDCYTVPVPDEEIDLTRLMKRELSADEVFNIGVIYHVVGDAADQALMSESFLREELRLLNDAYAGRLRVTPPFLPVDCKIQYYWKRIHRVTNSGADYTSAQFHDMYHPERGGSAIDSPLYYVNMYYCNIDFAGGYSIFPRDNTVGTMYDGNVIRIQSILNHRGVAAHEVGHWFDLYHTFQPPQASCGTYTSGTGDGVDDTPAIFGSTSGCPYTRLACFHFPGNPVNSAGQPLANVGNIMDYSSCEENFTLGQKNRMRAAILRYRPQLVNSTSVTKYNCSNFTCVASPTGVYTSLSACQTACVESTSPYAKWITKDTTITRGASIWMYCSASPNTSRAELWINGINSVPFNSHQDIYSLGWTPNSNGSYTNVLKVFNGQLFAWSDTLTITVGTTPLLRYNCANNTCVGGSTGTYATLSECQQVCIAPPTKYDCLNNTCVLSSNGAYSLAQCQSVCGITPENRVHTIILLPNGKLKFIACDGEKIVD